MDTVKSAIKIGNNLIYPETSADMVIYSDTTLKNMFDNYTPFEMSDFGKSLSRSSSLAEACRKMHINYFFAKDLIDNIVWNVTGNPETVNQKLHATNGNYIRRTLNLGAYDMECEFDLTCADTNKTAFQFFDNVAAGANNVRHWIKLATDSDGQLCFIYQNQRYGSAWGAVVTGANIAVGYANTQKHIKIVFDKANTFWEIYLNGSYIDGFTYAMATRNWLIYLGTSADCTIDNFKLTYNSSVISELDFD